jgi:hypothetical protein
MEAKEQMKAKEPRNVVQLNEVILEDLKEVLDTIEEAQYTLNTIEFRRKIFSKYKKAFGIMTGFNNFLNFTSVVAGSVGVSALAGVITAPLGLTLGGATIGSACLSSVLGWQKKTAVTKLAKHEKVGMLAVSKLNTINDLVSKAITNSHISTEEFTLIIREKEKYISMKNAIRKKQRETSSNIDFEQLRKTFLRKKRN